MLDCLENRVQNLRGWSIKALELKLKELEVKEKKLLLKYKAKELHNAKTCAVETSKVPFDVRKPSISRVQSGQIFYAV